MSSTVEFHSMTRTHPAASLPLNGALLMLAGLLAGAAIPAVPYPRLMLSAHNAGFTVSGLLSMVVAFCRVPRFAPFPRARHV
jgi:hypothetical protein